jgi:peptide/nickel transport system substrate-binding protein
LQNNLAGPAGQCSQTGFEALGRQFRLTRRAAMRGALALGFAGAFRTAVEGADAQTPVASPVANADKPSALTPRRGGALRMVRPGSSVANFNPAAFAQDPQIPLSYLEALVRPDPKTMRPMPWLAERRVWRNDGAELRLALRRDVVWHDGTPFEAADAAFSYAVYRDDPESLVSAFFALVQTIEVVAEHELLIRFSDRDPNWLLNAATLPIISSRQYSDFWTGSENGPSSLSQFDWGKSMPVGTGPWRVESWDAGSVQFARYEEYWRQPAWLERLEISLEEGVRSRAEAWEQGDSQLAWPVRVAGEDMRDDAPGMTVSAPAASVMFAAFNFANPIQPNGSLWTDLRVRQAASLAINRERYAAEIFGGAIRWDAAGTVAQPWAHDGEITTPGLNREAAEVLLAEAGWIDYDGDGVREDANGVPLRPVAILREDSRRELSAVMASVGRDLAEVGIDLIVETLPAEAFDERWIRNRDYDLIGYAYDLLPGFTDYDLYGSAWDIRTNPAGWNPGGYSNADADAAIGEFLSSVLIERQRTALSRLQRAVNDDLFALWFGFPEDRIGVAEGIEGFEPDIAWQTAQTWMLWRAADSE